MNNYQELKSSTPLVDFYQKSQLKQSSNLFVEVEGITGTSEGPKNKTEMANEPYLPYLKKEINAHLICDQTVYKDRTAFSPLIYYSMSFDDKLGLYDPILYLSDFWYLRRDLILMDQTAVERIKSVKSGQTISSDPNVKNDADLTEFDLARLNFDGKIKITFDNYYLNYLIYQVQFVLSQK